ncbi:hypothetical protein MUK42_22275 [Musa troglodytarum]|uniref:Uncharacterized protein n=1 Tax=Musa troglodytarum TaxID=320322 RepID=A0A9E7GBX4_9LILI|nr:hypothetical protein MUK42_22275 [Musa troglodytarum]
MVTLGQQPGLLAVRQLGEADRALEPLLEVRGPVDGDGQHTQQGSVEAAPGGARSELVGRSEHEARAGAAPPECGVGPQVVLGVQVEEEDEYNDHEEEDDRRYHHLAADPHHGRVTTTSATKLITRR